MKGYAMDSEEGGGEGHLHTEVGGGQQSSTGLSRREKNGLVGEAGGIGEVTINKNKGSSKRDKTTSIMEITGNVEDKLRGLAFIAGLGCCITLFVLAARSA